MATTTLSLQSNSGINDLASRFQALQVNKKPTTKNTDVQLGIGHAVGYIRVSTEKQASDSNSLEAQERKITDYCRLNNLILNKNNIYRDAGISGGIRDRPELNAMLKSLLPGMKVVITDIDRIARNSEHFLNIKNNIHDKGCSMYIINRSLDTNNADAQLIISMLASIAEAERINTKARIKAVMKDMKDRGVLRCKPRFGWRVENKQLVENPEEQIVIEAIRQLIAEDAKMSLSEICRRLTAYGFCIRKSAKIYPTTVKNIIEANNLRPEYPVAIITSMHNE